MGRLGRIGATNATVIAEALPAVRLGIRMVGCSDADVISGCWPGKTAERRRTAADGGGMKPDVAFVGQRRSGAAKAPEPTSPLSDCWRRLGRHAAAGAAAVGVTGDGTERRWVDWCSFNPPAARRPTLAAGTHQEASHPIRESLPTHLPETSEWE